MRKSVFHAILLTAVCGLLLVNARADVLLKVIVNTTGLVGHPAAPFFLDFQLTDGSGTGDNNNTVTLSSFQFSGGGGPAGTPFTGGGASGDLSSSVTLHDSSAFVNNFAQQFTAGTSLSFVLDLTHNSDAGGIPDGFSFAILDNTASEIPTLAPLNDFVDAEITANPIVTSYGSDISQSPFAGGPPINIPAPQVIPLQSTTIPEPGTLWLLGSAFLSLGLRLRRSRVD